VKGSPLSRRILPLRLAPAPGESFPSFVARLAWLYGQPVRTILAAVGVADAASYRSLPRGYGIVLADERLARFAAALDLDVADVSAMLLSRYDGVALNLQAGNGSGEGWLRTFAVREWVYAVGSHCCPACLAEAAPEDRAAVWKLAWKLPWSFACARHAVLLADHCPSCAGRLSAGEEVSRAVPRLAAQLVEPGRCLGAVVSSRRHRGVCGVPLARVVTPNMAGHERIVEAQAAIDRTLGGGNAVVGGETVSSLEYFRDLRSVCAWLLKCATLEQLGELPSAAQEAFACHEMSLRPTPHAPNRRGVRVRHRAYTATPTSAALMSAIVPAATALLSVASRHELAEAMNPLLETSRRLQTRSLRSLPRDLQFSPRLAAAFEMAMLDRTSFPVRLRHHLAQHTVRFAFSDRNVPQLLWSDPYERLFAPLLPRTDRDFGRRFCSMALLWLLTPRSWENAAAALDLPRQAVGTALASAAAIRQAGDDELFATRLAELAHWVNEQPLVDYRGRRDRLDALTDIPECDWRAICLATETPVGKPVRRAYAAVWLWCEMTGGDYRLSPGLTHRRTERGTAFSGNALTMYRRFVRTRPFEPMRGALVAYGHSLLGQQLSS
jgi:hypothetical protein